MKRIVGVLVLLFCFSGGLIKSPAISAVSPLQTSAVVSEAVPTETLTSKADHLENGEDASWWSLSFGFSYIGAVFLVLLLVPNLLWTKNQPQDYAPEKENRILLVLERAGQVLVSALSLVLAPLNLQVWTLWSWWLVAAGGLMVLYEVFWLRYFRGGHTLEDFYGNFLGVPVAGAALPVLAFFCLGLYARSLWLLLAVLILGVGHIGIHLQHKSLILWQRQENSP